MEQQTVTVQLPADIAQQAAAAGLLTDTALLRWLQRELDRREHDAP